MQSVSEGLLSSESTKASTLWSPRLNVLIGANGIGKTNCMRALSRTEQNQVVYHFHNTSETAPIRHPGLINDCQYLCSDAGNLSAYLLRLKQHYSNHYQKIVRAVQLVVPFFGDFHLHPIANNSDQVELEWTEKEVDAPLKASALSDGTLRFICLATLLNQPAELMPNTVLIDEPELGLHPFAIAILAAQLEVVSLQRQVIVSTQSAELLNAFESADIVVASLRNGETVFDRVSNQKMESWLEDYPLGELWKKNLLGGRPLK